MESIIGQNIETKLNELCNLLGTLDIRKYEHSVYDLKEPNIIVLKTIINEINNKIIMTTNNHFWSIIDFNKDLTESVMYMLLNNEEQKAKWKLERLLSTIRMRGIYNIRDNFYEIYDKDGKLLNITDDNWKNIHEYFRITVIKYALIKGINLPYIDFKYEYIKVNDKLERYIVKNGLRLYIEILDLDGIKHKVISVDNLFNLIFTYSEVQYAVNWSNK